MEEMLKKQKKRLRIICLDYFLVALLLFVFFFVFIIIPLAVTDFAVKAPLIFVVSIIGITAVAFLIMSCNKLFVYLIYAKALSETETIMVQCQKATVLTKQSGRYFKVIFGVKLNVEIEGRANKLYYVFPKTIGMENREKLIQILSGTLYLKKYRKSSAVAFIEEIKKCKVLRIQMEGMEGYPWDYSVK